ncbi:transmembrane protein 241 isoform X2 [Etheostoma spectabile]|uniref:transmembrane protein 241 isoform X2 n=1 Tax=Etheostoma spectabile TaxID=54343 RepID=UPI0013AF44C7|nr:transmembrane protein 241 isoform X2 [Etheostoma spectabile]
MVGVMSLLQCVGGSTCSGKDTSLVSFLVLFSLYHISRIRWQTFIGAVLLLLSGKFGWVEMSRITRSAAFSWLPGSLLFVGNIYAGSRALSRIDIPIFFTLQNSSYVVSYIILKVVHREKTRWLKLISVCLMLLSAINLPLHDPQFDYSGYLWAVGHLLCVGAYRAFQVHYKSSNLSDLEQQCINYLFSVLLLAMAAHPTGDLMGAMEFPSLQSYTFHCGCCASALLGFLLLLATVKLKSGLSLEHFGVWIFLSKSCWRSPAGVFSQRLSGMMRKLQLSGLTHNQQSKKKYFPKRLIDFFCTLFL